MGDALPEAFIQGAVDVLAGGPGVLGDGPQGLPEGGLVEGVGGRGLGGELRHLLMALLSETTSGPGLCLGQWSTVMNMPLIEMCLASLMSR